MGRSLSLALPSPAVTKIAHPAKSSRCKQHGGSHRPKCRGSSKPSGCQRHTGSPGQRAVVASALAPALARQSWKIRIVLGLVAGLLVCPSKSCVCAIAAATVLPIPHYSHILLPPSFPPFGPQVHPPTCHQPNGPKRNATQRLDVAPIRAPTSTSSSCLASLVRSAKLSPALIPHPSKRTIAGKSSPPRLGVDTLQQHLSRFCVQPL
jgi:hypothetical protein